MSGPLRRWATVAPIWASVALFSVAQIYIARAALGHPPPLGRLLILELPIWAFWAVATAPIVMLARRFPLGRRNVAGRVAMHVLAAIAFAVAAVAFQMLWYQSFNPYPLGGASVGAWFWQYFRQYFIVGFMIYWATIGVYHAFANYFLYRERELEAQRARALLTEARLQALKMQLHPHFLFNTLNSVSALLASEPANARRVLAQLSDLLRASLRSDALHLVPLSDEMDFLERYLDIEQLRFGDRLEVKIDVAPSTERAAIPSFLLQPLVENAIRHGLARRESEGRLWVSAERLNGSLLIHVMDNGPGLPPRPAREGVGLTNTRRRLAELYGDQHTLSLGPRPGGGLDVRIEIPFRPLEDGP